MRHFVSLCVFVCLLSTPALAKSRRPAPAPTLTGVEQICRGLGEIAFAVADARDHGLLLSNALGLLRKTPTADMQVKQYIDRIGNAIIYDLYGPTSAHVTPAQAQRILDTLCITQGIGAVLQLYGIDVATPALVR